MLCVRLLGRNEGGLTLDRETVYCVLTSVHRYFDSSPTADANTTFSREQPAKKATPKVQLLVDMVIADASEILSHALVLSHFLYLSVVRIVAMYQHLLVVIAQLVNGRQALRPRTPTRP